jgi:hypothetical protein
MRILHTYSNKRIDEQEETWELLSKLDKNKWTIVHILVKNYDYYKTVVYYIKHFQPFIVIEQDIVPSIRLLEEMANCSEQLCSAPYILYPQSTLLQHEKYSCRNVISQNPVTKEATFMQWVTPEDKTADYYSLGLTKFNLKDTSIISDSITVPWTHCDHIISQQTFSAGLKAHLHWGEIKHNHK